MDLLAEKEVRMENARHKMGSNCNEGMQVWPPMELGIRNVNNPVEGIK